MRVGRRRLVIPEQLRDKVVSENHDALFSGHFSVKKMLQKLGEMHGIVGRAWCYDRWYVYTYH